MKCDIIREKIGRLKDKHYVHINTLFELFWMEMKKKKKTPQHNDTHEVNTIF